MTKAEYERIDRIARDEAVCQERMSDTISRQAVIDEMEEYWRSLNLRRKRIPLAAEAVYMDLKGVVVTLPSAQPERTCVNCGRTANNGGWYADGRTRCPIKEHYALPKVDALERRTDE